MASSDLDNTISALEKAVSSLAASSDSLEVWLWVSSAAVVVGVALEWYFIISRHRLERQAWRRGSIPLSPEKPSAGIFVSELLSVALVVLGVAGELLVGIASSNKNSELRDKNKVLVSLVNEKANDAIERAGTLEKSNKQLGLDLETEKQKTARFEKEADVARLALEKGLSAAKTNARYAMLSTGGRHIWDTQAFVSSLKKLPKGKANVLYRPDDAEAYLYAEDICLWLGRGIDNKGAGWAVSGPTPWSSSPLVSLVPAATLFGGPDVPLEVQFGMEGPIGVAILAKSGRHGDGADLLSSALGFSTIGIDSIGPALRFGDWYPDDSITIIVGKRP